MVVSIHKGDFQKVPGEESVRQELRNQNIRPGSYAIPCPESMKEMGSPEMLEKYNQGPVGYLVINPNGPPAMGKILFQWFLFSVLISYIVAYVAALGLSRGDDFMTVFRFTTTTAILGHAMNSIPDSIWVGQRWGITLKFIFDGVLYGLVTGVAFGWLWPAAM